MKKVIVIIIVLLAICGGVGYIIIKNNGKNEPSKKINVIFDSKGGSEVKPIELECGKELKLPENPTKEGFTFGHWEDKNETPILDGTLFTCDGDVTLYAKWEEGKNTFNVIFDSKGGSEVKQITVECGKELKLPENPTKEGSTFGHWEDKNGTPILDGTLFTCDGDVTLYAKWDEKKNVKTFKVTFNSNGGSNVSPINVECGKELKLPKNPTKEGFTFGHWEDKNGTAILDGALLSCDNVTLYAKWDENKKSVTYTCPEGYELTDNTKCTSKVDFEMKCKTGWTEHDGICVNPNSPNIAGTRTCPSKTYSGWTGTGTYYFMGRGYCGYQELTSYIGQQQNCTNNGGTLAGNNHCYKHIEPTYQTTCAVGEKLFKSQELAPGNGGGCYQIEQKKLTCPDNYSMNYTINKCVKTIDAIKK